MLTLKDIHWQLPDREEILKGISFSLEPGKLKVITGPNGSGKTSLAKIIAGLETPTSGIIDMDGTDITGWDITERAKAGIGFAFQQPVSFKGLTVRNLLEIAAGRHLDEDTLCYIFEHVGLCFGEYIDRHMDDKLSGGERKRIEIATVLARDAKYLVFDEPEAGIDLWSFSNLINTFQRLKETGKHAMMVISHQERILEIADEIIVVADGQVRTSGTSDILPQLLADEKGPWCPLRKDV